MRLFLGLPGPGRQFPKANPRTMLWVTRLRLKRAAIPLRFRAILVAEFAPLNSHRQAATPLPPTLYEAAVPTQASPSGRLPEDEDQDAELRE